jgi:hypothetical protein
MERILIFIKHNYSFFWKIIEWGNGLIFSCFYKSKLEQILSAVFNEFSNPPFSYRRLDLKDAGQLHALIRSQSVFDLEYFHPHKLDLVSIKRQFKNRSFVMMGAFDQEKIIGYFFLRFFINRKSFVGRLIDKEYRGKAIGTAMNIIMYETVWQMRFRCFSTISQKNKSVMRAHAKNPTMIVRKKLQSEYLLVEFVRTT